MADAQKDERTLIINDKDGESVTYNVSDFSDEAKVLYEKIAYCESKSKRLLKSYNEVTLELEQNNTAIQSYIDQIKELLPNDDKGSDT